MFFELRRRIIARRDVIAIIPSTQIKKNNQADVYPQEAVVSDHSC